MTATDQPGSFLDWLLSGEPADGPLHAQVAADQADLDAGRTWGLYRDGVLIETFPALWMAGCAASDAADANDLSISAYQIQEIQ